MHRVTLRQSGRSPPRTLSAVVPVMRTVPLFHEGKIIPALRRMPWVFVTRIQSGFVTPMLCIGLSFRRSPGAGVLLVAHVLSWGSGFWPGRRKLIHKISAKLVAYLILNRWQALRFYFFRK